MSHADQIEVEADIHASDEEVTLQSRQRKMTPKGLEYTLTMKMKILERTCKGLERMIDVIMDGISTEVNVREISDKYKKWIGLFDNLLKTDQEYRELLPPEQLKVYRDDWFEPRYQYMREFQDTTQRWLNRESSDDIPDRPKSHTSSSIHSSSSGSSIRSARIAEESKKAEITIRAEQLKQKNDIEKDKLRLKHKEEELQLQGELQISQARCHILEQEDDLKSDVRTSVSKKSDSAVIESVVRQLNKPTAELQTFKGDPLTYKRFMRQFRSKVVSNCPDPEERINYLEQYTSGEARDIVIGYSYLDSKKGYEAAIKELDDKYGDQDVIVNAFIAKALSWTPIKSDNTKELDRFAIFLTECQNAVSSFDAVGVLNYSENLKKIVGKLPYYLHDRWRNLVFQLKERGERVTFATLVSFIRKESKKATDPTFGKQAMSLKNPDLTSLTLRTSKENKTNARSYATTADVPKVNTDLKSDNTPKETTTRKTAFMSPCTYCEGNHTLEHCESLHSKPFYERLEILKNNRYCYGCLKFGHIRKNCRIKATCITCKGRHPSVLHVDGRIAPRTEVTNTNNSMFQASAYAQKEGNATGAGEVTLAIIPVKVHLRGSFKIVETYAFLDPGSNVSFCSTRLMHQLNCEGRRQKLTLNTMGERYTMYTHEVKNLQVCDLNQEYSISLPVIYTKDILPVSRQHIPTTEDLKIWPHLRDVELPQVDAEIGLLLGNGIPDAYSPLDIKVGPEGTPYVSRTRLGLIAWNIIRPGTVRSDICKSVNRADVLIHQRECCKDLEISYQKSVAIDFPEKDTDEKLEHSIQDKMFIHKLSSSKTFSDGHYEFSLPFKDTPNLPDNRFQALRRLQTLKKKLVSSSQFHDDYSKFMNSIISNGYAEEVPANATDNTSSGRVWYLPHHGVYNPKKPEKIRVVFDCSTQYKGVSLNSMLLSGPDLTNSLLGVLLRFRQEQVAIVSDVECMFYQVKVAPEDRDYLRFFWWPNGNLALEPELYRMTVHLFGATSSPSCANYALHQTVEDNREYFEPQICQAVERNFYVDDFLYSVASEEEAMNLIDEINFLCLLGGFHLTKWMSNKRQVLETVDEQERAKQVKDLSFDEFTAERALGVHWDVQTDTLGFNISSRKDKPTRRNVLSLVSSVYDPLGIAAPFVLTAKIILQEACRQRLDWDQELSDVDNQKWLKWLNDLPKLAHLSVPRCLKPAGFGEVVSVQLHHFSDASDLGYGMASYLRTVNYCGRVFCTLLLGRSRVTPLKKTTIPRLELTAAVLAVRISQRINCELDMRVSHIYWTDSMSVIGYIANETTRFHTFVANRIAVIRNCTSLYQWKYIESRLNPADLASRGSMVDTLTQSSLWLHGPQFLYQQESQWPIQPVGVTALHKDDPEVKQPSCTVNASHIAKEESPIDILVSRCSSWLKLKRVTGWVLMAMHILRARVQQRQLSQGHTTKSTPSTEGLRSLHLPDNMLEKATRILIQDAQVQYYSAEIQDLCKTTKSGVRNNSTVYKLDPFMKDGLLRVGGRLSRAHLPYDAKHQILVPRQSPLSSLILQDIHKKVGHLGKNSMIAELRQTYWIPKAASLIQRITAQCVICRTHRVKMCSQKMADLPENRVVPDEPPFSHTGVDYFGPFFVKRGRSTVKRYGVIFTCFSSRAVHLEIAHRLDTDSCIHAIRRFLARRGSVKSIRSDNGTNLVGAERELRESIQQWNQTKISRVLQQQAIKWEFNPPSASHFGGVWERLIRMIRKVLYSLMHEQVISLDDEGLHTLFCEVESIINSRPITPVSDNPDDIDALTPNDLLLLRPGEVLPCGVFDKSEQYSRRRWRQMQFLANLFWKRWTNEYLHLLQGRQKWLRPTRNVSKDDIVLIMDQPRNAWMRARVLEVVKDKKGHVRVVKVRTPSGVLQRPIHKISLVLENDSDIHK